MEIELPDGTILEAPDDADPSVVAKAYLAKQQPQAAPPQADYGDLGDAVREPLVSLATGSVAMPIAGLIGLGAAGTKALGLTDAEPGDVVNRVQGALTYQPRTRVGQQVSGAIAYPFEKLAQGGDWAGQKAADFTGSPAVGAAVNTAVQSAPALLAKVKGGRPVSNPVARPVVADKAPQNPSVPATGKRQAGLEGVREAAPAPTKAELAEAAKAAYKRADEAGVVVKESSLKGLKTRIVAAAKKEGIDKDLHPDASAALNKIIQSKGNLTLTEVETLRKVASDASGSVKPADRRIASIISDELDSYIDNLSDADVVAGDATKAKALREARGLYTRMKKADTIDKLMQRAEDSASQFSGSGLENAITTEFRKLAKNEKEMRKFTEQERDAIRLIARGGSTSNKALRFLGKFAPTGVVSGVLTGGAATMIGGPLGAALPIAGVAGRYGATRMTKKNVERASEIVRRGPQQANQPANQPARNAMLEY